MVEEDDGQEDGNLRFFVQTIANLAIWRASLSTQLCG